ncbi:hypothetical protein RLOC_00007096 [Lonchura striata]|uniref:Uncharacterized protein n=1 Tax=Lonchura striata TaxID=40157 RepID=A0A218UDG2_9PASE|nr:hypothetical protein RLOC_00007096 [Lonchura striata domestica]
MFLRAKPCFCMRLVAMSPWAGLLSTTARVSLLLLLGSVLFSCSSLGHRVPEFALTKIEESDMKDDSGKEPGTEDDADPEDLEVFYPTDQWQTLRPGNCCWLIIACLWRPPASSDRSLADAPRAACSHDNVCFCWCSHKEKDVVTQCRDWRPWAKHPRRSLEQEEWAASPLVGWGCLCPWLRSCWNLRY